VFKAPTNAEKIAYAFAPLAFIPLKMWLYGWALEIVGGPEITRMESFILVWAVGSIVGGVGLSFRKAIVSLLK
jgi:hypothetical protein